MYNWYFRPELLNYGVSKLQKNVLLKASKRVLGWFSAISPGDEENFHFATQDAAILWSKVFCYSPPARWGLLDFI